MQALACEKLSELPNLGEYDCIGVDEGQFFPDIVDWSEMQANSGKVVIVAALDGDYMRRPFGQILDLVPMAEDVTKLSAVCMNCHQPASFSQRMITAGSVGTVDIGGAEKYRAVCRRCYFTPSDLASPSGSASQPAQQQQQQQQHQQGADDTDSRSVAATADSSTVGMVRSPSAASVPTPTRLSPVSAIARATFCVP